MITKKNEVSLISYSIRTIGSIQGQGVLPTNVSQSALVNQQNWKMLISFVDSKTVSPGKLTFS